MRVLDERGVTFKYKDYRSNEYLKKTMTLTVDEFIRRFLIHVLPSGFHRIRHYGFLANAKRVDNIAHARVLLKVPVSAPEEDSEELITSSYICRLCAAPMVIIETFAPAHPARAPRPMMRELAMATRCV